MLFRKMRCYACGKSLSKEEVRNMKRVKERLDHIIDVNLVVKGLVCYNCLKYRK